MRLRRLLSIAEKAGAIPVIGEYLPPAKNAVVANLCPRLPLAQPEVGFLVLELAAGVDDLVSYIFGGLREATSSAMMGAVRLLQ